MPLLETRTRRYRSPPPPSPPSACDELSMSVARSSATFRRVLPAARLMSVTPPSMTGALSFSSRSSTVSETGAEDLRAPSVSRTKTLKTHFEL